MRKLLQYRIVQHFTFEGKFAEAEVKRFGVWWGLIGPSGTHWVHDGRFGQSSYYGGAIDPYHAALKDIDWHKKRRTFTPAVTVTEVK